MTCIVGIKQDGKIYMGGDSASCASYHLNVRADAKVFINGPCIMGFTSSWRMGQLLRYALKFPKLYQGTDIYEFMVTTFVDEVRKVLKDGGFAEKEKEAESGGVFLVGYAGRLFTIQGDYQVGEHDYSFASVGCGQDIAHGSLCETEGVEPDARIKRALTAAERFSGGVRAPFVVLSGGEVQ